MRAHAVVRQPQVFNRIDIGHARNQNTAGVHAQVLVIRDVHFLVFGSEDRHQGSELFFRGTSEAPVNKWIIRILLEHIPGDRAAGVDEVGFQVGVLSHFLIIEGRRGKHVQIFQATALQQLGDGTLQRHAEVRVCTEGGEAGAVRRVEQHDADHRVLTAQRAVIGKDWETFGFQFGNGLHHARIAGQHVSRDLRQADGFCDNAVFNMTLKHLGQALNARFVAGVTGGHAV